MSPFMRRLRAAIVLAALAVPGSALYAERLVDERGFVTLLPGQEVWNDVPGYKGIQVMVVEGDPRKPAPYVIRVKFSPGVMSMPHRHPEDRLVTVIKGTWYTGKGGSFEPWTTDPLPTGSFMKHPAGAEHYDGSREGEVIVQIAGVGPSGTEFIAPELGHTGDGLKPKP